MKDPSEKLKAVKESQEDHFKFPCVKALQLVRWSILTQTYELSWWSSDQKHEGADDEKQRYKLFTDETLDKLPKTEDRISPSTV